MNNIFYFSIKSTYIASLVFEAVFILALQEIKASYVGLQQVLDST